MHVHFSYNLHIFCENTHLWLANGDANCLITIAIHLMTTSFFSRCLLEAVLQLTLTVVFKQLRLHNYCLKASFANQTTYTGWHFKRIMHFMSILMLHFFLYHLWVWVVIKVFDVVTRLKESSWHSVQNPCNPRCPNSWCVQNGSTLWQTCHIETQKIYFDDLADMF